MKKKAVLVFLALFAIAATVFTAWDWLRRRSGSEIAHKGKLETPISLDTHREDSTLLARLAQSREKRKIVFIGLDAATWNIIEPMIEESRLPTFKMLLEKGSYGNLRSVVIFVTPPAWISMMTGCAPWKTGIYGFAKLDTTRRELLPVSSLDVRVPAVWDMVSEAGLKVAVVNIPVTYPPRPVNGIMVTSFFTPGFVKKDIVITLKGAIVEASIAEVEKYGLRSYSQPMKANVRVYDSEAVFYLFDTKDDGKDEYDFAFASIKGESILKPAGNGAEGNTVVSIPDQTVSCRLGGFTPWVRVILDRAISPSAGWARLRPEKIGRYFLKITCTPVYNSFHETGARCCYPDSLKEAIAKRFERFIPSVSHLAATIPDIVDDTEEYIDFFYSYDDWDLFIYQFRAIDAVQHIDGFGRYTQEVLMRIDRILGDLFSRLPRNTTFIIASDHGARKFRHSVSLNAWLDKLHLIARTRSGDLDSKNSIAFHHQRGIYVNRSELEKRTRAISGFEPPERKDPYNAFLDFLIEKAAALRADETNVPIPIKLIKPPRSRVEPSPDLIAYGEYRDYQVDYKDEFHMEKEVLQPLPPGRNWHHRRNGIFIIVGDGIKEGFKSGTKEIYDITPTMLYILGLPTAHYFDGKVMEDIFEEDFLANYPRTSIRSYYLPRVEGEEEDIQKVKLEEKLRAIGYIE